MQSGDREKSRRVSGCTERAGAGRLIQMHPHAQFWPRTLIWQLGAGCRQGEVMVPAPSAGFGSVVTLEPAAGEPGVGKADLQGSPPPQLC